MRVEIVRFSRELDVVFQIGSFEAQLVWLHHELLEESGNQHHADDVQSREGDRSYGHSFPARSEEIKYEKHARRRRDGNHHPQCRAASREPLYIPLRRQRRWWNKADRTDPDNIPIQSCRPK